MATRARKQTIADTPFVETTSATESVAPEPFKFDFNALMAELPSWKRITCAWIASMAAAVGAGYIASYAVSALMVGAFMLTGSTFLAFVIYFAGVLLTMWIGGKAAYAVHMEIITERIDARYDQAKSFVTGLFGSKKVCTS